MKTNELMEKCREKFDLDKVNNRIRLEIGHIDRAYMIGYNCAIEKAIEWLNSNIYDIKDEIFDITEVVVTDFETKEQALSNFKAKLHPYSVEQIDNCVDIK